ncbi:MORN repeat-containing protein 4-like isoform X1 [Ostrinia furnacalis]|uniref:MORN repeat-containing protein 4-like isoform X1 n=2 Tax=Ostrinia TaxID=29056 RepID=UPI00103A135D|nr:MORN repeat-containing protein 4-like isoform X1 [Ostrinia furnacalis]XP_028170500.1 MORN repeat-containing protein 4-like isoform X1 [Ostrinia furnacalis]XP_028170501.1 MORN repeat-containing protein 4-like isoform X1 [Ostrinia furnacalis]XP_028170503.1 MORN repeat-containing protein 4-like isoform X1 [Ostrinia furnacalis]
MLFKPFVLLQSANTGLTMTDTTTEVDSENTEAKKPVKEIPVVQDQGFFQHDTGDTYDGFFEAKKKDRVAKMHGPGLYTTVEGDTYMGTWDADKLGGNDEVTVAFTDGSRYEGFFKDWSYSGRGRYYYPDGSILRCDFSENSPVGFLTLSDPNDHIWLGKAEQGYGWFEPVNHFYDMLEKTKDSGKSRRRLKSSAPDSKSSPSKSIKSISKVKS